jgi:iron-sulfur cluster repair protein YtfE (RIC family)
MNRPTTANMTVQPLTPEELADLANRTIRDLVEAYPDTLGLLAPLGIDLCCGGGHPLGEALDLHGIDRTEPMAAIARIIARQRQQAG